MVVRLDSGRDAVQAYVAAEIARGRDHVVSLVEEANDRLLSLVGDLTEAESRAVTPADEWAVFDVLRHLTASVDRGKARIETLTASQPFLNPQTGPGQLGGEPASYEVLRRAYADGVAAILDVLRAADPERGLHLTSEHATMGPFNWLGWAVYSHYVHVHDHIGQVESIRAALRGGRSP